MFGVRPVAELGVGVVLLSIVLVVRRAAFAVVKVDVLQIIPLAVGAAAPEIITLVIVIVGVIVVSADVNVVTIFAKVVKFDSTPYPVPIALVAYALK